MDADAIATIRAAAIRIAIRLALGDFQLGGPQGNVMEVESRVAWATIATELAKEGYTLVSPEEYAERYGVTAAVVAAGIEAHGSIFALEFAAPGERLRAVPLEETEAQEELGPLLV
jgi:hypothetical protein